MQQSYLSSHKMIHFIKQCSDGISEAMFYLLSGRMLTECCQILFIAVEGPF